ncbi:putative integral membrane protein conserved region-domain-containing protein [Boletus reticuloceps]|uniref:Putative integral membrane protein conserved region-domain-containing protein n=1 Tax=Boletus reticuloceps TaxID=495285 RepID=A0A8I3AFU2_9AGAM|nr:putative integral membrane protein conserved region-domain-containing protein [Boletus reticuloceps]
MGSAAQCYLKPRSRGAEKSIPCVSKEIASGDGEQNDKADGDQARKQEEDEKSRDAAQEDALAPWFIFVRSCVDMEDWYLALVHASDHPSGTPTLSPLKPVFLPSEMNSLVTTLDEQPDVIPMRWFSALLGRIFYSIYKTQTLESYIISRLMKKLSKVKRPAFLTDVAVTQFSVGDKAPTLSKPMLKELTKEGDASLESYTVKLVLAVVVRELEGNLLVKVKRPPSSRMWYGFTKTPRMVINVEPIVSDRQITWSMILNTIEAKIEETCCPIWTISVSLTALAAEVATKPFVGSRPQEEATLVRTPSEREPVTETPSLDSIPIIRSVTTSSQKTSTATRRRSWFSSGADTELEFEHAKEVEEEVVHGKRERSAGPNGSLAPPPDTAAILPSDASDNDQSSRHSLGTSTTSSFLSALKSKAGDKQALSNTAKEAMWKWGVWGLEKDVGGNPSPDDFPDSTRGRQSYADMRAAVIERREREQSEKVISFSDSSRRWEGTGEVAQRVRWSHDFVFEWVDFSGLVMLVGRQRVQWDFKFTEAMEENSTPSLIHTQLSQGRTMTIPGIHASHRGEVMSIGNMAPVSPGPESKPKGATTQSMYRLWKSPILTASQEAQASTSTSPGRRYQ